MRGALSGKQVISALIIKVLYHYRIYLKAFLSQVLSINFLILEQIMAKKKRKSSKEEKVDDEGGQTNLGFEPCEPGDIVKSRSKEDISTINKNLTEDKSPKPKVSKKKKFKNNSDRIENDLFEGEPKKKSKKKRSKKASTETTAETTENIELAPIGKVLDYYLVARN